MSTSIDILELIKNQEAFKKEFRKVDNQAAFDLDPIAYPKNQLCSQLVGKFSPGRVPYIHQIVLSDSSQIRLKFCNTIKQIRNSKGQELQGKESFLSYLEIAVLPAGQKGYMYTVDVVQSVWAGSKSKAQEKNDQNVDLLKKFAGSLGIDLSAPQSWCTVYSEDF